jgi:formamidopyrimidine-DNA glycosylase
VPELPEVETVVRDLRPLLVGRRIAAVEHDGKALRRPWSGDWITALVGRRVAEIRRRGKWIVLDLSGGPRLVLHLGMTGQLVVMPAHTARADHTHLVLGLDRGGRELRFRDIRRFGSATLFASEEDMRRFFEETQLGPEPFELDRDYWRERLAGTARVVKAVLLDQRVVAGVGNIYADESLFAARLHPARIARQLRAAEAECLRRAIAAVLTRAIDKRGSSIRDYVGGSGMRGGFQEEFRVYGQTGRPCRRCRTPIVAMRLAGRATHYCPKCQR